MENGMPPDMLFMFSHNTFRFRSLPISPGISPNRLLPWNSKSSIPLRLPIPGGIIPEIWFFAMLSHWIDLDKLAIKLGSIPPRVLSLRSIT
ncbi:Os01g0523250 [Oryza sativa Japonica Group]|uniref:Os01g0523250 protein n=1 Tax=Oryza sativa subsp. japonica TaxID=39947 RepID=A0A0P0V3G8_ORYSJ|nr:hypothetical protein EE612_003110 [Oryza sativa]BAS72466.1 Os01g0523250 [Oryza sativa Japonica Group]